MSHPDTDVWSYAQTQACAIVTQDADFADIRAYPPPHAGIVILDIPDRLTIALKMQIVLDGLTQLAGQLLADTVVTISPGHVRVRR